MHAKRTPRYIKTRHPGVYYEDTRRGRSYSISYKAEGRLIWKQVPGGEREAVTARAAIIARMGRGERVAPSRELFEPFAAAWLDSQRATLSERTIDQYDRAIRLHLKPAFGTLRLHQIDEDRIAAFIADMAAAGKKPWTIRGALVPLGRILNTAVRRGRIPQNPLERLDRSERPTVRRGEQRILSLAEIGKLLDHATTPKYRALLSTAIATGLRQSELLGLVWGDVDWDEGLIHLRAQLSRQTMTRKPLKTGAALRSVILPQSLATTLRAHRLASEFAQDGDYVFAAGSGRPLGWSNVDRRCLHKAAKDAGIPHVPFHALRHTFASLLIAQGADPVFVAGQLGHSSPTITMAVYAHLWEREQHATKHRDLLDSTLSAAILPNHRLTTDAADGRTNTADLAQPRQIRSRRK